MYQLKRCALLALALFMTLSLGAGDALAGSGRGGRGGRGKKKQESQTEKIEKGARKAGLPVLTRPPKKTSRGQVRFFSRGKKGDDAKEEEPKGAHDSGKQKGKRNKHEEANARRKREQEKAKNNPRKKKRR